MGKVAVIPARGGSKRIPRKNIRVFAGRPMVAYAIEVARTSGLFDHVVVSTDDPEISEIAQSEGAEVPFVRPRNLADDFTPTVEVISHAILACSDIGWQMNHVCCIYPAAPFITVECLKETFALLEHTGADYCFPIAQYPSPVQRALVRDGRGFVSPFFPSNELERTQDLNLAYYDAGQFYWGRTSSWLNNVLIHSNGVGFPVSSRRVVDIDTEDDWDRAESIYNYIYGGGKYD